MKAAFKIHEGHDMCESNILMNIKHSRLSRQNGFTLTLGNGDLMGPPLFPMCRLLRYTKENNDIKKHYSHHQKAFQKIPD